MSSPAAEDAPLLRYFACRGRGQALVYMLEDSGQPYTLDQAELAVGDSAKAARWQAAKADKQASGPFGQLPSLRWGDVSLGQTEAIARYLARRLGYYPTAGLEQEARCDMYASVAYQDVCSAFLLLLWAPVRFAGSNPASSAQAFKTNVDNLLRRFEDELQEEGGKHYLLGTDPTVADFFLFEALGVYESAFGSATMQQLFPTLSAFYERMSSRERIKAYLASGKRPIRFSGSPAEESVLQSTRALASSSSA